MAAITTALVVQNVLGRHFFLYASASSGKPHTFTLPAELLNTKLQLCSLTLKFGASETDIYVSVQTVDGKYVFQWSYKSVSTDTVANNDTLILDQNCKFYASVTTDATAVAYIVVKAL